MSKYRPIQAKSIIQSVKGDWFGSNYNMNLYRGCEHRCIYCDSRSACYQIEDFDHEVLYKVNAIELLQNELATKKRKGVIGTGAMCDPYMPAEEKVGLTRQALEVIHARKWPIELMTKSDRVLRDKDLLSAINQDTSAVVTFTITTPHDELSRKIEPYASVSSKRIEAIRELIASGVVAGASICPVLPYITDDMDDLKSIASQVKDAGGEYCILMMGVTLRDVQRAYFYQELDKNFPSMRKVYEESFGDDYHAVLDDMRGKSEEYKAYCESIGLKYKMSDVPRWPKEQIEQISLF